MMRLVRNNGDIEPSAVGHILSPYEESALIDCEKLLAAPSTTGASLGSDRNVPPAKP